MEKIYPSNGRLWNKNFFDFPQVLKFLLFFLPASKQNEVEFQNLWFIKHTNHINLESNTYLYLINIKMPLLRFTTSRIFSRFNRKMLRFCWILSWFNFLTISKTNSKNQKCNYFQNHVVLIRKTKCLWKYYSVFYDAKTFCHKRHGFFCEGKGRLFEISCLDASNNESF